VSDTAAAAPPAYFVLPGFAPDAVLFAARMTLAMLLAYYVAFFAQVESASTAGICVAIVTQVSAGMAAAKARYRIAGTLIGGCVGLGLIAAFPQDRLMLLGGFALWLAVCTYVATLLRDFRSYGAALSGYTAGIIAVGVIAAPQTALSTTLDRVAAILIGIASVLAVDRLLAGTGAFDTLVAGLRARRADLAGLAADVLEGRSLGDDLPMVQLAAGVAALQTQASYTAAELPDGHVRANGARHAIASLLAMVSTSRAIAAATGPDIPAEAEAYMQATADELRGGPAHKLPLPRPAGPTNALLLERVQELAAAHRQALLGLQVLTEGGGSLPPLRLRASRDHMGALLGAVRVLISVGLGSVFCVLAGWGSATLVLIQQAAFVSLLGTFPNPTQASLRFGLPLLPIAVLAGAGKFLLLPGASGYTMFALVVGSIAFVCALAQRHNVLGPYVASGPTLFTIILGPSNPQTFDLGSYVGTVVQVGLAMVFVVLSFNVIFPVSQSRQLARVAVAVGRTLRRTVRQGADEAPLIPAAYSLLYDRMSRALEFLGRPTPARLRLLGHIYGVGEVDLAVRRAWAGLAALGSTHGLAATRAGEALRREDSPAMLAAAQGLLDEAGDQPVDWPLLRAVSGLTGAALLLQPGRATLRFYRKLMT
jgi:uncharacterized membrane protein YccC